MTAKFWFRLQCLALSFLKVFLKRWKIIALISTDRRHYIMQSLQTLPKRLFEKKSEHTLPSDEVLTKDIALIHYIVFHKVHSAAHQHVNTSHTCV